MIVLLYVFDVICNVTSQMFNDHTTCVHLYYLINLLIWHVYSIGSYIILILRGSYITPFLLDWAVHSFLVGIRCSDVIVLIKTLNATLSTSSFVAKLLKMTREGKELHQSAPEGMSTRRGMERDEEGVEKDEEGGRGV